MRKLKKLEGTFVVTVTPMDSNEEIDLEALKNNVEYYIKNKVHGICVGGSTGEFYNLSLNEHKTIIKDVVKQVNGRIPVIAGTAACSTNQVIELTEYAKNAGADGALIVPPFYYKTNENELFEHFKTVTEAVDIPIMLYNNPWTSKIDMQPSLIARLAKFENISYVKESTGDITRIWKILNLAGDDITVFCGSDNLALESFLMGAKGWICVAANFIPKQVSRLYELACIEKDLNKAKVLYKQLLPSLNFLEETGKFAQLAKAGLELMGKKAGPVRKPLLPADKKELEIFTTLINKLQQK